MKDWELHLALNDPADPIHDAIEQALDREELTMADDYADVGTYGQPDRFTVAVGDERYQIGAPDPGTALELAGQAYRAKHGEPVPEARIINASVPGDRE